MRLLNEYVTGTYTGTDAAQSVSFGFKPQCVIVWQETDGTSLFIHLNGMGDDTAISFDTEVAAESADCVTLSASGFSVGTSMSTADKLYRYLAF